MNDKTQIEFIPFHAINEFMRSDFRLNVIKSALLALPKIDKKYGISLDRLTRKHVRVAGFRNSVKAPATVKAVAMVKPFENEPRLVAAILAAWAESQSELRQQLFNLLSERGWKIFPVDFERTRIPGFLTRWPEEDDYDEIYEAYVAAHPDSEASMDETSLMAVWLALRLPVEKVPMAELAQPNDLIDPDELKESES